ncbi:type II secretion system protein GspM [Acinetobacter radioresistens]|jgi:general secretion pathway protein M|uniref:type II secretion system protein GspM n=1 Tax=Acinetobacter radioresistens TaxID=40216 RepID=UPI0002D3272F|nr:type II secretion system protein GspM [Acinetobacter radioresistens]
MKIFEKIDHSWKNLAERIEDYLDGLSLRERIMVIFTTVFVLVTAVGWSLWTMHKAADDQQKRLNDLKDLMVRMQTNAVTMKPAGESQLTPVEKVQRISQQQGLSASIQATGKQLQISVQHDNYAVLANFLTQMAQMGLSIEKMELINQNQQIRLIVTVQ